MSDRTTSGLPELSVRRPLLIGVLNMLIIIAGFAGRLGIDVRELPDVDRSIVSVRATYPGAAPETVDAEVTSVFGSAVARVSGVREINAFSEQNSTVSSNAARSRWTWTWPRAWRWPTPWPRSSALPRRACPWVSTCFRRARQRHSRNHRASWR